MSTLSRFAAGYMVILTMLLLWWLAMIGSTSLSWALLIAVAYGVPLVGWGAITSWGRLGEEATR